MLFVPKSTCDALCLKESDREVMSLVVSERCPESSAQLLHMHTHSARDAALCSVGHAVVALGSLKGVTFFRVLGTPKHCEMFVCVHL